MSELRICLFGKFDVIYNDEPVPAFNSANVQQLLSYLLLNRDYQQTRETLAALFWPEASPAQSKAYLRKALWQLQSAFNGHLPSSIVVADNEWIYLNPKIDIWLDIAKIENAFNLVHGISGPQLKAEEIKVLHNATMLYRGDLLEGWFQDWCLQKREQLQSNYLIILDKLMDYCETHNKFEDGLVYGMRILHVDSARERTHRQLMRLYYYCGHRTEALRQYERCMQILDKELNVLPAPRTTELYEQIRENQSICSDRIKFENNLALTGDSNSLGEVLDGLLQLQEELTKIQDNLNSKIKSIESLLV